MNKKLISLAVAAALVAPAAAMADAVLYGKLNVSLDWVDAASVILPYANMETNPSGTAIVNGVPVTVSATRPATWVQVNGAGTAAVPMKGTVNGVQNVTLNTRNTPVAPFGAVAAIDPQTVGGGSKFNGWGMARLARPISYSRPCCSNTPAWPNPPGRHGCRKRASSCAATFPNQSTSTSWLARSG